MEVNQNRAGGAGRLTSLLYTLQHLLLFLGKCIDP